MMKQAQPVTGDIPRQRADRRQLQQIIAGLTEGVILVDPDQTIFWANEAALQMHGVENLGELGATVEAIEVTDLRDNTYYALVHLEVDGRRVAIDSRPSDAISLALRTKSPIYVAKKVLESSSVLQQMEDDKDQNLSNVSRDKWAEILEKMAPNDFKYKM